MTQARCHLTKFIGIDPGKGGGIAVLTKGGNEVKKCPDTVQDMSLMFALMVGSTPADKVLVMLEKVWARPHDGRSSVFTFAQNYGRWEGIISTHEIIPEYVTPQVWMKGVGCPVKLKKQDRKNYLKQLSKDLYPKMAKRLTLKTADAMLVAHYAKHIFNVSK